MDMLVLADQNGVVDMTPTAIAAMTRIPIEKVRYQLDQLSLPDSESRTPDHDGRRIALLDEHRTWGWQIINYEKFRKTASEEQRREATRIRVAEFKKRKSANTQHDATKVTHGNASLTHGNAGNAMQKQKPEAEANKRESPDALISLKEVFDAWNCLTGLPKCLLVSDKRRRMMEARFKEPFFTENWKAAMQKVQTSKFCQGESERGWRASFEWFITPDAVPKIMEGKYDTTKTYGSKTNSINPAADRRNAGTLGNTDYGEAGRRKLARQEADRVAKLAAANEPVPSPVAGNGEYPV